MRAHLYLFVALGFTLVGCSKEEKQAKTWKCQSLGVPGGESLECSTAALTSDGPVLMGDGAIAAPVEETCEGSQDNPELCPPDGTTGGAGGSSTGTGTSDGTSSSTSGGGTGGSYLCVAGTADCPPIAAIPGLNTSTDGTSSTGDGTGGGGGSATTGDGKTTDGTSSTGTGGTGGGGGEVDEKDQAKGETGGSGGTATNGGTSDGTSSTGSGTGKGGGSGSGPETYKCQKMKGGRIDCTLTTPKCVEGTTPSGGMCTEGGTATSDGTGSTGDGSSGTGGSSGSGGTSDIGTNPNTPSTTTDNGKSFDLIGVKDNGDGTKTWTYEVCEVSGQDLSNWVLGIGSCIGGAKSSNQGFEVVKPDPNSGLTGVKWNTGTIHGCTTYSVTTQGGTQGLVKISAKSGTGVSYGMVPGPVCQ